MSFTQGRPEGGKLWFLGASPRPCQMKITRGQEATLWPGPRNLTEPSQPTTQKPTTSSKDQLRIKSQLDSQGPFQWTRNGAIPVKHFSGQERERSSWAWHWAMPCQVDCNQCNGQSLMLALQHQQASYQLKCLNRSRPSCEPGNASSIRISAGNSAQLY